MYLILEAGVPHNFHTAIDSVTIAKAQDETDQSRMCIFRKIRHLHPDPAPTAPFRYTT
jgi:hypothetical protein